MTSPLPTHLRLQLDAFKRRLFIQETVLALAIVVGGLAGAWVVLFLIDRFYEAGLVVCLGLMAAGLGVAGWGVWRWVKAWVLHARDDRQLAVLVQRKHRKLGDTLLGAIELAEGRMEDAALSAELREAAIGSVAKQAAAVDFLRAISWSRTWRFGAAALACAGVLVTVGVLCLPAWRATFARLANPFAAIHRYTFTRFEPLEDPRVVAMGEPFEVKPALDPTSEWKPREITYQLGDLRPGVVRVGSNIQVPGLAEPTTLGLAAGDGRLSVRLRPEARPTVGGLLAKVALPDYLQLPPVEEKCGNALTVVAGAKVALEGAASRPLARMSASAGGMPLVSELAGTHFMLHEVTVDRDLALTLEWTDTLKLAGAAPHEVKIRSKPDQAPAPICPRTAPVVGMLADEVLRIPLEAVDDFGLKNLGAHCHFTLPKNAKEALADRSLPVLAGAPDKANLEAEYVFSPRLLQVPEGATVDFSAQANDYFPGRAAAQSAAHRIVILTRAQHAQLIQDQMAQLANKLEELAAREQQAKEENEERAKAKDADLAAPKSAQELAEQAAKEKENAEAARKLAEELAEIARQAQRNKDMPKDLMEQLEKVAENIEKASEEESPAASKNLDAAKAASKPEERREALKKAAEHQQKEVDALRKSAKQLDQVQRKLDAQSFVNRLKKEAQAQLARVEEAKKLLPQTVGQKASDMAAGPKAALKEIIEGQQAALAALRVIEADLQASYARMHHEPYREVTDAMEKEKAFPRNQEVIVKAGDNQLFRMMVGGRELAALYEAWAEKLQDKQDGGGKSGEGKSGQIPPEVLAALMRLIEQEQDLRLETRSVGDSSKARGETTPGADAKAAAQVLSGLQDEVLGSLVSLVRRYQDPPANERAVDILDPGAYGEYATLVEGRRPLPGKLVQLLGGAANAMHDASGLLQKGEPGAPTIAAETEAIELLAKVFAEGSGKPGKPGPPSGMMQQMMSKMMSGTGSTPGKGPPGNGTASGRGPGTHKGEAPKKPGDPAGGETGGLVPPEFQAQIEAYHKQLDQLEGEGK